MFHGVLKQVQTISPAPASGMGVRGFVYSPNLLARNLLSDVTVWAFGDKIFLEFMIFNEDLWPTKR